MTEELKKQGGLVDAAAADAAEEAVERAAMSTELDDAAKAAAEREARRQAFYEENVCVEDERDRAPPVERGCRRPLALLYRVREHCVLCHL